MSTLTVMPQNDNGFQEVPGDDNVHDDIELFNLSTLSDSDLLPDELPHQVSLELVLCLTYSPQVVNYVLTNYFWSLFSEKITD